MLARIYTVSQRRGTMLSCAAIVASSLAIATGCGKKDQPAPAAPPPVAGKVDSAKIVEAPKVNAPPPPPEIGMVLDTYVAARTLEMCARKYEEPPAVAEKLAIDLIAGRKFEPNLQRAFERLQKLDAANAAASVKAAKDAKNAKIIAAVAAPAAPTTTTPELPREDGQIRAIFRRAHDVVAAYAPAQAKIDTAVKTCLYSADYGVIDQAQVDKYAKVFADVVCLQHQMTDAEGKFDGLAHAQAAAKVFSDNQYNAADFAKLGVVFGRIPLIQEQIHKVKEAKCPDPRAALALAATTGEFSGQLKGDRFGALNFRATASALEGAVQWQGVPPAPADGTPHDIAALPIKGALSGDSIEMFGQIDSDFVRISGKLAKDGKLSGTWKAGRNFKNLKGTFTGQRLEPAPAKTPGEKAPSTDAPAEKPVPSK